MTAEEIVIELTDHDGKIERLEHRIKEVEGTQQRITDLTIAVNEIASSTKTMCDELKQQGRRLDRLEQEPIDSFRYYKRLIVGCIITGVLGAVVGAFLHSLF